MTKHKIMSLAAIVVLMSLPLALGAISQAGLLFLTFEPGARASGLGRAYSAVADDAYAAWWSPGATAFNRQTQINGTHMPWLQGAGAGFDDMFYEYLGFNKYFDGIGNLNIHLMIADLGTQMQTDETGQEIGEFHSFDFAGAFGYAYEVVPTKLGVGANFKLVYSYLGPGTGQTEDEGKAFGFAFDMGAKYQDLGIEGLDASLVVQNVGPNITYVDQAQSDPLPMTVRLGAAYQILDSPLNKLLVSAEASKILANEDGLLTRFVTGWENFDETIYGLGAEYTYLDLISLRGGYFLDQAGEVVGPSFGAGIQYTFDNRYKLTADFGMITAGELTDYNKVFSVGFQF